MNGQDPSRGGYSGGGRFDFGNILGDPFALATISVSVVGKFYEAGKAVRGKEFGAQSHYGNLMDRVYR